MPEEPGLLHTGSTKDKNQDPKNGTLGTQLNGAEPHPHVTVTLLTMAI